MPRYTAPLDDMRFVLHELLNVEELTKLDRFAETAGRDLVDPILEEAGKISSDVLFPVNMSGDVEGCKIDNNQVTTPEGFQDAYTLFAESGWCGVAADPEFGGMGLPNTVNFVLQEMFSSANMSFAMYPGLSHGAYHALELYGTDEQKALYLPKLASGEWSGTMNLTEPQCGTDLGLIRTKAVPSKKDTYTITGQKIYISAGEHDLTSNIVHLVLARLPNAPEGVKGISLFVVPKFLPNEAREPSDKNNVHCASIEHKMGIKASATCVMVYEDAIGWLVGEPHKGLRAMFAMMNAARLGVGMQGLGIAEVSYQNALDYAKDRLQMRALDGVKAPDKEADPIIVHPDVRRMLLTQKAFIEGARAMSYWIGKNLDIAEFSEDPKEKQEADDLVALMTPILKAYCTDMGSECANLAVQILGGAGYIQEYGVEQYVRDARIAQIYEGTNGIQALDLVGRKMPQKFGRLLRRFFHPVQAYIEENQSNPDLAEFIFPLAKAFAKLQQSTGMIAQKGLKDPNEAGAASVDYLKQFALVAMGYMWCQMAQKALEKRDDGQGDQEFYQSKLHTAQFFMSKMLPDADACFKKIMAGAEPVMAMEEAAF